MGTNGLPEMQGFETQRHRGHGEGGIALRVARMFGVANRWWLGLRGMENRRECN